MAYRQRLTLFFIIDSAIVLIAVGISWLLVHANLSVATLPFIISFLSILLCHHFFSFLFKLYKKVWEYASIAELLVILKIVTFSLFITVGMQFFILQEVFFRFLIVTWVFHMLCIGGSRFIWRIYRDAFIVKQSKGLKTLIIGAGSAGTMVARQLLTNSEKNLLPVAFVDDDINKHELDILGLPVIGGICSIVNIVEKWEIDNIIIAIPSLEKKALNKIFEQCVKTNAETKILPLLEDIITGKVSVSQFRNVEVEDLLERDPVHLDIDSIAEDITEKVVLVTGAGGSIGSEIARQISTFKPSKVILLGRGENSIYTTDLELKGQFRDSDIAFITEVADVQDENKMMNVIEQYKPNVIYHAAAHKHVPLMEQSPEEAVKNNIIGTMNVAKAASIHKVETFVMVSTDKAVKPTSVMGATKKLAEMIIQSMNKNSSTKFVTVRFGNVLGSRGSVIPLFKRQIELGGPVTVTHPDMVRYFMTIPEASKLVIQAGVLANGGEIFVLDMGEPVKIIELAKNLIQLSGQSVEDIGIEFTGIRPGEKLYEELLNDGEIIENNLYPKIHIGKTTELYWGEIDDLINNYINLDRDSLRKLLIDLANKDALKQDETAVVSV